MRASLSRDGLYVILRFASERKPALGFKVKLSSRMLFSERNGYRRGVRIGPLYLGSYAVRTPA